jgi:hypothetical protein
VGGDRDSGFAAKKDIFGFCGPIFRSGFAAAIPHTLSSSFPGPYGLNAFRKYQIVIQTPH